MKKERMIKTRCRSWRRPTGVGRYCGEAGQETCK
jgi:hypothetical protein